MSASFTSCSKDENPEIGEDGVVVNEKKLTKVIYSADGDGYFSFSYDDKGRLIEAEDITKSDEYTFKETMIWGDDAVKINRIRTNSSGDYSFSYTLPLTNGLVQSYYFDSTLYNSAYNQSNRIIEWGRKSMNTSIIWDGDKLVSATEEYGNRITDYILTYEKSCKKGYYPFLCNMIDLGHGSFIYYAHPELFGMRTTQLPASVTANYSDSSPYKVSYSYELDKDGYISKITFTDEEDAGSYILTWE